MMEKIKYNLLCSLEESQIDVDLVCMIEVATIDVQDFYNDQKLF